MPTENHKSQAFAPEITETLQFYIRQEAQKPQHIICLIVFNGGLFYKDTGLNENHGWLRMRRKLAPVTGMAGWPDTYFAVIFTAQRTMSDETMYQITADRMVTLAQQQPGFLGVESVRGDDGVGITVSYWQDRTAIRNWRMDVEHLAVQQMGRKEFYEWYHVRVAEIVGHRMFDASLDSDAGRDIKE